MTSEHEKAIFDILGECAQPEFSLPDLKPRIHLISLKQLQTRSAFHWILASSRESHPGVVRRRTRFWVAWNFGTNHPFCGIRQNVWGDGVESTGMTYRSRNLPKLGGEREGSDSIYWKSLTFFRNLRTNKGTIWMA